MEKRYQSMRERFEKVNTAREAYLRDLELANAKIQKIQEENDLLLDAMLANPPPSLKSSQRDSHNTKSYQSPLPPHPVVPSQTYPPMDRTTYQPAPAPPPANSAYQYVPRSEHPDHGAPAPPSQHNYNYPHQQPSRQYQYPPYAANDGRDVLSHHYSGNTNRSRGPPPDVSQR
ncbi:hypothetical protein D9756_002156 [Leucocoprinus leucothites]|uniref:Uncharacterized protein n=1 Tax=Leucocoprinus leucothites TaxID=201217 RepID=A0A8H5GCE2_9AGAR|nr:hypothetical protein D9756_002156 [Leucoagaricus leucothites]